MRLRWGVLLLGIALLAPPAARGFEGFAPSPRGFEPGARFAQRWDDLSPSQQKRALQNYERYQRLSPEKREDVDRRYRKWKELPASDKERYRERYEGSRHRD